MRLCLVPWRPLAMGGAGAQTRCVGDGVGDVALHETKTFFYFLVVRFYVTIKQTYVQWDKKTNLCFMRQKNKFMFSVTKNISYVLYDKNYFLCFMSQKNQLGPKEGYANHPSSVLIRFLWMMGNVLYSTGKIMNKFSDLYFSSYHQILGWWRHKKWH